MAVRILAPLAFLLSAAPALAGGAAAVPEGSNLMLLSLGVLGVIIGRRVAMRHPDQD